MTIHEGVPELAEVVERAASLIADARYVVVMSGAGMSAESGIPTFRGPGGVWNTLGQPTRNGYKVFLEDPVEWWRQHNDRSIDPTRTQFRDAVERAAPNAGHLALVELERSGVVRSIITQNVDGLHQAGGSVNVIEIHGSRHKIRCVGCGQRWGRHDFAFRGMPPRCPECDGLVKSDTVMFGEPIPRSVLDECYRETEQADCMVLIGTSATVFPAANLPNRLLARGGVVVEINPMPTRVSLSIRGRSGAVVPDLAASVLSGSGARAFQ